MRKINSVPALDFAITGAGLLFDGSIAAIVELARKLIAIGARDGHLEAERFIEVHRLGALDGFAEHESMVGQVSHDQGLDLSRSRTGNLRREFGDRPLVHDGFLIGSFDAALVVLQYLDFGEMGRAKVIRIEIYVIGKRQFYLFPCRPLIMLAFSDGVGILLAVVGIGEFNALVCVDIATRGKDQIRLDMLGDVRKLRRASGGAIRSVDAAVTLHFFDLHELEVICRRIGIKRIIRDVNSRLFILCPLFMFLGIQNKAAFFALIGIGDLNPIALVDIGLRCKGKSSLLARRREVCVRAFVNGDVLGNSVLAVVRRDGEDLNPLGLAAQRQGSVMPHGALDNLARRVLVPGNAHDLRFIVTILVFDGKFFIGTFAKLEPKGKVNPVRVDVHEVA